PGACGPWVNDHVPLLSAGERGAGTGARIGGVSAAREPTTASPAVAGPPPLAWPVRISALAYMTITSEER
ncbi:hypothetical protein, partial [Streptomyces sp. NPDC057909]|uniref:hypothetical protein n=1 Tax=Streptomyces sp. NPDC057909 TaxID=3346277 RepID=UPI0036DFAE4F